MRGRRRFAAALVLTSLSALVGGAFQRLYSNEAVASSVLQNDWNKYSENYQPKYALDDDPKTAWVEGVPGNGEGQSLTVRFSVLKSARTVRVRIHNGYQRSKSLLAANAAPRQVTLSLLNAVGEEVFHQKATLTRTWGGGAGGPLAAREHAARVPEAPRSTRPGPARATRTPASPTSRCSSTPTSPTTPRPSWRRRPRSWPRLWNL